MYQNTTPAGGNAIPQTLSTSHLYGASKSQENVFTTFAVYPYAIAAAMIIIGTSNFFIDIIKD